VSGSVFKRCGCRDEAGKPLGSDCPRLAKSDHGSWYYKAELAAGPGGTRRRARKGGFATKRDAQRALVDLLDRVNKRTHQTATKVTVGVYLSRWLAGKSGLRSTTVRSYNTRPPLPRTSTRAPPPGPAIGRGHRGHVRGHARARYVCEEVAAPYATTRRP
jgi:hypothetical protein